MEKLQCAFSVITAGFLFSGCATTTLEELYKSDQNARLRTASVRMTQTLLAHQKELADAKGKSPTVSVQAFQDTSGHPAKGMLAERLTEHASEVLTDSEKLIVLDSGTKGDFRLNGSIQTIRTEKETAMKLGLRLATTDGKPIWQDEAMLHPPKAVSAKPTAWQMLAGKGIAGVALWPLESVIYFALSGKLDIPSMRSANYTRSGGRLECPGYTGNSLFEREMAERFRSSLGNSNRAIQLHPDGTTVLTEVFGNCRLVTTRAGFRDIRKELTTPNGKYVVTQNAGGKREEYVGPDGSYVIECTGASLRIKTTTHGETWEWSGAL